MFFNMADHYWVADDGRVYGSARQTVTNDADQDFVAWANNFPPTVWPQDDGGNQTDDALQAVLLPYGLFVNLTHYTADTRWRTQRGGITVNDMPFATDALTLGSLNSAYLYTQDKLAETFSWKLPDGTFVTLDQKAIQDLQEVVSKFGQDCYECEAATLDSIDAGSITTREQIDVAFAAIPNTFPLPTMQIRRRRK